MSSKSVKVYKNFPLNYKIRKPRYWYVDKTVNAGSEDKIINVNLRPFNGLDIIADKDRFLIIPKMKLWDGTYTKSGKYVYANGDKEYLAFIEGLSYTIVGSLTISDGVFSGFSKNNYLQLKSSVSAGFQSFEVSVKFKLDASHTNLSYLFCKQNASHGFYITANRNLGYKYDGNSVIGKTLIDYKKWYWAKVVYKDGAYYGYLTDTYSSNLDDWSLEFTSTNNIWTDDVLLIGREILSGSEYFHGAIDLDETYIKVDNQYVITDKRLRKVKGLSDVVKKANVKFGYSLFRDENGETVVTPYTDIDTPDKTWFGDFGVLEFFNPSYYTKNYTEEVNCVYSWDGNYNILAQLSPKGYLLINEDKEYIFSDIPEVAYFPYTYRFTSKVTTGTVDSTSRVIGRFGFPEWVGLISKKFAIYNKIQTDTIISSNTTYWLRIIEYCDGNGNYTHKLLFLVDNGYTKDTLPNDDSWTTHTVTNKEQWLSKSSVIERLGEKSSTDYSWNGTIDLTNTWFDKSIDDNNYEILWRPLEV